MRSLDDDSDYGPLREAQKMAEELVVRVQRMSLDLRPAMLDDLGLLPTLTWHFDRYQGQTGINVLFDHQDIQDRFPREIETAGYRIVQEALTNVARHADVEEVRVRANLTNDVLLIFIEDRGEGFLLEEAMTSGNASGLVGMRERALSLGGDLKIITTQGSGTQVLAELPLIEPIERRTANRK
jgi:signal transduction histidine kinase